MCHGSQASCSLERRTSRAGRDSIGHMPGGHDDVCNAAAGALLLVQARKGLRISPMAVARFAQPAAWQH